MNSVGCGFSPRWRAGRQFNNVPLHPLSIPHVLELVMTYTTLDNLRSCRLVNRQWNSAAIKLFQSRGKILLDEFSKLIAFCDDDANWSLVDICPNFCLVNADQYIYLLSTLLAQFGPRMKSLEVHSRKHCRSGTEAVLLDIAKHAPALEELALSGEISMHGQHEVPMQLHPMLPNIQKLRLHFCNPAMPTMRTRLMAVVYFKDVLAAVPNVTDICCTGFDFQLAFLHPVISRRDFTLNHLTKLDMNLSMNNGLSELANKRFPLTTLAFRVSHQITLIDLHKLLLTCGSTLTNISIWYPQEYSHVATSFPSSRALTKLRCLYLSYFRGNLYFIQDLISLKLCVVENSTFYEPFPSGDEHNGFVMPSGLNFKIIVK